MPNKSTAKAVKGSQEEQFAEHYLQRRGLDPIVRNYRCRLGEIDLIMTHGDVLVFIEVRQRKNNRFGSALESISFHKQTKLIKAANYYIMKHPHCANSTLRFDVIGITGTLPNADVEWVQNAFGD